MPLCTFQKGNPGQAWKPLTTQKCVIAFLLSFRHFKVNFNGFRKQKTLTVTSGFPFAEKEGFEPPEV